MLFCRAIQTEWPEPNLNLIVAMVNANVCTRHRSRDIDSSYTMAALMIVDWCVKV